MSHANNNNKQVWIPGPVDYDEGVSSGDELKDIPDTDNIADDQPTLEQQQPCQSICTCIPTEKFAQDNWPTTHIERAVEELKSTANYVKETHADRWRMLEEL